MENPSILPPQGGLKTEIGWKGVTGSKPGSNGRDCCADQFGPRSLSSGTSHP